jgi:formylglycine-generating enzyme required for sulfatase activity
MGGTSDQPPVSPGEKGEPAIDAVGEPITDLICALEDLGLRPDSRELAGALWLAACIDRVSLGWSALDAGRTQSQKAEKEGPPAPGDEKEVGGSHGEARGAADEPGPVAKTPAFPLTARTGVGAASASTVSAPDRSYLPQALHLGRAWRMLRRPRPSRRERELDLGATVERLAEQRLNRQGLWDLVYRARPVPRLDLTLVVDRGPSMAVWEPQTAELAVLLRRTGVFNTVRIHHLDGGAAGPRLLEAERPIREEVVGRRMPGAEPGHMLTLVLSDAISAAWYAPATYRMLARLSGDGVAVLVQLMPPNRWIDTALGAGDELRLGVVQGRDPQLPKLAPLGADGSAAAGAEDAWTLPVISQTPWGVRTLVAVLRGGGLQARLIGYRFGGLQHALAAASPYAAELPPDERLERFLSVASPAARRLAGYLSRLPYPLTVRMMLLVQRAMQPGDDLSSLAEVFSGGLLELHRLAGADGPKTYRLVGQGIHRPDTGPVVRGLGNLVSRDEAWTVLCAVTQELKRSGQHPAADWPLLIEDAAAGAAFRLPGALTQGDAWERAFALIAVDVARRRGGVYRRAGERLAEAIAGVTVPQPLVGGPGPKPTLPAGPTPFRDRYIDGSGDGPAMIWLPDGTFRMGSPEGVGDDDEHPDHEVTLSHYAVGEHPVTVGEFRRFVEATGYRTEAEEGDGALVYAKDDWDNKSDASWRNPYMRQDDAHPVVCISWNDAKAYCRWLTEQTGQPYGLLTEAQWEYACRAGSGAAYCFGDDAEGLDAYAWFGRNARDGTRAVRTKAPNAWQLHDMHGNVWEWCEDWFGDYSSDPQQDTTGPESGSPGLSAAAPGAATPTAAARRTAAGTSRRSATTTSASASRGLALCTLTLLPSARRRARSGQRSFQVCAIRFGPARKVRRWSGSRAESSPWARTTAPMVTRSPRTRCGSMPSPSASIRSPSPSTTASARRPGGRNQAITAGVAPSAQSST